MIYWTSEPLPRAVCGSEVALARERTGRACYSLRYEPDGGGAKAAEALTFDRVVREAILGSAGTPFFAIAPLTREIRSAPEVMSRVTDVLADSGLGYLTREERDLELFMARRRRVASYEEWVFGCCTERFPRPREARWFQKATAWTADTFCRQLERVTCLAVYHGETGESALWASATDALAKVLRQSGITAV